MTIVRQLVDTSLTRWYHCITRCAAPCVLARRRRRQPKEVARKTGSKNLRIYIDLNPVAAQVATTHRATLSPRQGFDLGGAGRKL